MQNLPKIVRENNSNTIPRNAIEPFDAWDFSVTIPDPTWKIPEWLALPTDDPEWMPDIYRKSAVNK